MDPVEDTDAIGNPAEALHLSRKQQPEIGNSVETLSPAAGSPENLPSSSSPETLLDVLGGGSPSREPGLDPLGDPGATVEELTLKNYRSSGIGGGESLAKKGLWENLTGLADGSRVDLSKESLTMGNRENMQYFFMQQLGIQRPPPPPPPPPPTQLNPNHLHEGDTRAAPSTAPAGVQGGVRTKMAPSMVYRCFVKNSLKGKGVTSRHQQAQNSSASSIQSQGNEKSTVNAANLPSSSSPETLLEDLGGRSPSREPGLNPLGDPEATVEQLTLKNYRSSSIGGGGGESLAKKGLWQNLTRLADRSRDDLSKESLTMGNRENMQYFSMQQLGIQRPPLPPPPPPPTQLNLNHLHEGDTRAAPSTEPAGVQGEVRTNMVPSMGYRYFVKNSWKGKGVTSRHQQAQNSSASSIQSKGNEKSTVNAAIVSDSLHSSNAKAGGKALVGGGIGTIPDTQHVAVSLREWLSPRHHKFDKVERMHTFKQILELVDISHSQGLVLQDLRPSYLMILSSNQVKYKGSFCSNNQMEMLSDTHHIERKRYLEQDKESHPSPKNQKIGEHSQFGVEHNVDRAIPEEIGGSNSMSDHRKRLKLSELYHPWNTSAGQTMSSSGFRSSLGELMKMEERWYASPEELNELPCSFSSNIYYLGVLFFELFCYFETWQVLSAAMSDLRHRILPPNFLSESPKESSFCLWLLHPKPSSRPKSRDILKCDFICEGRDLSSLDQSYASIDEEDTDADLLLQFLLSLKAEKDKHATKLVRELSCLEADINEVHRRRLSRTDLISNTKDLLLNLNESISDMCPPSGQINAERNEERLMRNIDQLEDAYFSVRFKIGPCETNAAARLDKDALKILDSDILKESTNSGIFEESSDCLGSFFEGLCKFGRYSRFEVRGSLRNADILNSANVICSLSFDRDEEYFAAAGVSKKIKIFEFGALLNDDVDVHYPMVEMSSRSKLSCVCWNGYIKNYLASTDYDGVVQLWDASTGQGFIQYREHQKRAWSVDFSQTDPVKLASGGDDCSVKLWSINEKNCIDTIRSLANVCCVQFSHSSPLLAFGSSDYKVYCYDLRNTRIPWCTLSGHGKAVSYVKFIDSETLISASTDNTLKLWDLNKTDPSGLSTDACSLTFAGHTNEKNFVGLSVSNGYIACGSETNEVYSYYKTLPMPMTSHKFGATDPITGQETADDNGQFVSSVCWRGKSDMVVAANSTGSMKLLQLV